MKKVLSVILACAMLITTAFAANVSDFSDIPDNWAKESIENAIENGLLNGSNGKINPNGNLTRAEMAAILVRATNAQTLSDTTFADVSASDWFSSDISKAVAMEVLYGANGKVRPNDAITREETMVVLARLLKLENVDAASALAAYSDADAVSTWAADSVAAMISAGYVNGSNGKINPKSNITRAEFAAIMDRIASTYISNSTTVTGEYTNVMINAIDGIVVLKDAKISGNLILGDGVDEGKVYLDNTTIGGKTIVRGGTIVQGAPSTTEPTTPNKPNAGGSIWGGGGSTGGSSSGGSSSGTTSNADKLIDFKVFGIATGSDAETQLVAATVTDNKCVVDLSGLELTDAITSGYATTEYGTDITIGSYAVPTNENVSLAELFEIVSADNVVVTESISVGALKNLVADQDQFKAIFEAETGNALTGNVIEFAANKFTVKTTLTRSGETRTITFEVILPA